MIVYLHMATGSQTWVLCKTRQLSQPLSHLSSPSPHSFVRFSHVCFSQEKLVDSFVSLTGVSGGRNPRYTPDCLVLVRKVLEDHKSDKLSSQIIIVNKSVQILQ